MALFILFMFGLTREFDCFVDCGERQLRFHLGKRDDILNIGVNFRREILVRSGVTVMPG